MKRLFALALLLALALTFTAQAVYYPVSSGLTDRIATRSGPSTDYNEIGTFFGDSWKNTTVKALSKAQSNGVTWVQIEFTYKGTLYRAYTGERRLSAGIGALPEERQIGTCAVQGASPLQAYTGPGTQYKATTYKVPAGAQLAVYDTENGFAQVDYLDSVTFFRHRCWLPISALNYSGSGDYRQDYPSVTPTPAPSPTDWSNYDWGSGSWRGDDWSASDRTNPYTGSVAFAEGDTFVWTARPDTRFVITSGTDLSGCAMMELTVLGEITYHNLCLFMDSAEQGSFTTLDGRQGSLRFYDTYAILTMDLNFAGIGSQFILYKTDAAE